MRCSPVAFIQQGSSFCDDLGHPLRIHQQLQLMRMPGAAEELDQAQPVGFQLGNPPGESGFIHSRPPADVAGHEADPGHKQKSFGIEFVVFEGALQLGEQAVSIRFEAAQPLSEGTNLFQRFSFFRFDFGDRDPVEFVLPRRQPVVERMACLPSSTRRGRCSWETCSNRETHGRRRRWFSGSCPRTAPGRGGKRPSLPAKGPARARPATFPRPRPDRPRRRGCRRRHT